MLPVPRRVSHKLKGIWSKHPEVTVGMIEVSLKVYTVNGYCKWNEMMVLRSKFLNFNVQIGRFTSRNYTYWSGRIVHRRTSLHQKDEAIFSSSCSISTLERLVYGQYSAVRKTSTKFGRDMDEWRLCKMCVAHENWRHSWRKQIRVCVCVHVCNVM